jgi:hypothetical protein
MFHGFFKMDGQPQDIVVCDSLRRRSLGIPRELLEAEIAPATSGIERNHFSTFLSVFEKSKNKLFRPEDFSVNFFRSISCGRVRGHLTRQLGRTSCRA